MKIKTMPKTIDLELANQLSQNLLERILAFSESVPNNNHCAKTQWFINDIGRIYIRVSKRLINSVITSCIDIAAIELETEYRGHGIATKLIENIHNAHKREATYIECVHSQGLCRYLVNNQWIKDNLYPSDFNFYKLKD